MFYFFFEQVNCSWPLSSHLLFFFWYVFLQGTRSKVLACVLPPAHSAYLVLYLHHWDRGVTWIWSYIYAAEPRYGLCTQAGCMGKAWVCLRCSPALDATLMLWMHTSPAQSMTSAETQVRKGSLTVIPSGETETSVSATVTQQGSLGTLCLSSEGFTHN